jgi:hypothetical protein
MPANMQDRVLGHHAHFTTEHIDFRTALAHLPADDLLILAHTQDHQAHTAINLVGWYIFGPNEDVPPQFWTADGYINNE